MQRHFPTTSNNSSKSPSSSSSSSSSLNFNSWRKHIFLVNPNNDEELNSAWEDVKSIFNSGKRKRLSISDSATRSQSAYGHSSSSQFREDPKIESEPPKIEEQEERVETPFFPEANNTFPYNSNLLLNFVNLLQSSSQQWNNVRAFELLCREQAGIANNSTIKTEMENRALEWDEENKKKSTIKFSIDSLIKK